MWSIESNNNNTDCSCAKLGDELQLNIAPMAQIKEAPSIIDIDEIIASKNISKNKTIELLRNINVQK
jgi:hypothetical protein